MRLVIGYLGMSPGGSRSHVIILAHVGYSNKTPYTGQIKSREESQTKVLGGLGSKEDPFSGS